MQMMEEATLYRLIFGRPRLLRVRLVILSCVSLIMSAVEPSIAADLQVVNGPANQQVDVFSEFNTSGTVFVKIIAESGEPCADFWWIKWPFGAVQQAGRFCGFARFDIPGIFRASVASKLRAGGF